MKDIFYMKEKVAVEEWFGISVSEMDGEQTGEGMSAGKITKRQRIQ